MGGLNLTFADGSARLVSERVDRYLLRRLALHKNERTRGSGASVPLDLVGIASGLPNWHFGKLHYLPGFLQRMPSRHGLWGIPEAQNCTTPTCLRKAAQVYVPGP